MKCPLCKASMASGSAKIARSTGGVILDAVTGGVLDLFPSPSHLYFTADGAGDSTCVDHSRRVWRCPQCEALLISGVERD
jgi:hypothetical protein